MSKAPDVTIVPHYNCATTPDYVYQANGYGVQIGAGIVGWVYQPRGSEKSGWSWRNDGRGWFGSGCHTRRQAVAALVELASASPSEPGGDRA